MDCNECVVTFFKLNVYFNKLTTASLQHLTNVWKVSERVNSPHIGLLYKLLKVRTDFNQVWGGAIVLEFIFGRLPWKCTSSDCTWCGFEQLLPIRSATLQSIHSFLARGGSDHQIRTHCQKFAKISAKHSPKLHFRIFNIYPITAG